MLLDFAMPDMNGAEVMRAARTLHPSLPVVFISGYSDTAAIEAVAGENAVILRKPFRVDDLRRVLVGVLETREG
jgi:CheY-like chemotaxis protein